MKHLPMRLAVNAANLTGARMVALGSRVLYVAITARLLGPELYGLFVYAQSWYMLFFAAAGLGLPSVVIRAVGRKAAGAERTVAQATAAIYLSSTLLTLACGAIGLLVEKEGPVAYAVGAFALALAGRALAQWAEILFIAHESAAMALRLSAWFRPLEPAAAGAVLLAGGGVVELALAHAALWWAQAARGLILARRTLAVPAAEWNFPAIARLVGLSAPLLLSVLLVGFIQQGPILLHKWYGGVGLGALSLLIQLVITGVVIPSSVLQSLLPAMARNAASGSGRDIQAAKLAVVIAMLFGATSAIVAGLAGPWLILPVFGQSYVAAADLLWVAASGLAVISSATALNQFLVARGRFRRAAAASGIGAATLLAAALTQTPAAPEGVLWIALLAYAAWLLAGAALAGLLALTAQSLLVASIAVLAFVWLGQDLLGAAVGMLALLAGAAVSGMRGVLRQLRRTPGAT